MLVDVLQGKCIEHREAAMFLIPRMQTSKLYSYTCNDMITKPFKPS